MGKKQKSNNVNTLLGKRLRYKGDDSDAEDSGSDLEGVEDMDTFAVGDDSVDKPEAEEEQDKDYDDYELDEDEMQLYQEIQSRTKTSGMPLTVGQKKEIADRPLVNNVPVMKSILGEITLGVDQGFSAAEIPWHETLVLSTDEPMSVRIADADDDIKREAMFYQFALNAVSTGYARLRKEGIKFTRPDDYYAEMVKTDAHMLKIKKHLLDIKSRIETVENRKKQRETKKIQGKVRSDKLQKRAMERREHMDTLNKLRGDGGAGTGEGGAKRTGGESFEKTMSNLIQGQGQGQGQKNGNQRGNKRDNNSQSKLSRKARDDKFGYGGKKRRIKSNTAKSTNSYRNFSTTKNRELPTRGIPSSLRSAAVKKRPGKAKRQRRR